jgi:hypothetical protein
LGKVRTQVLAEPCEELLRYLISIIVVGFVLVAALFPQAGAAPSPPAVKPPAKPHQFTFRDVGDESGLAAQVAGMRGHAAGWGDVDGDGFLDLYVGAFKTDATKTNQFFRNVGGKFQLDPQEGLRLASRPTSALFADLDNDGDLEIYVSSMPAGGNSKAVAKRGQVLRGCTLFRNDGGGKFTDISAGNGACPEAFGGRSATVLDFDGDGLLDLLVGEDPHAGYNGSATHSTRLFRNKGNLQFEDATAAAGIPPGIPGFGVAAADMNGDGWPDIFIAASDGGNVLLLNDGHGKFREAPGSRKTFEWPGSGGDNMVCGVCIGDVNRDGLPDIVIGPHFDSPWKSPVPVRLFLNRGVKDGVPTFEDITERAGLQPLPMKAPHVELQDFDNDGWPDLYVSIAKFDAAGRPHPLIYRNAGVRDGIPHFAEDVMAVNDFPNAQDRSPGRSGTAFDRFRADKKIIYMAAAPSGDFDNDGRLDLFMANWFADERSLLLRNETAAGGWLDVIVEGANGVNRMGIGAKVSIYPAGKVGDAAAMICRREIAAGYGYASGQPAIAHFGLGAEQIVDVEIVLPHGKGVIVRKSVTANQRIKVKQQQ